MYLDIIQHIALPKLIKRVFTEESKVCLVNLFVLLQFLIVIEKHCIIRACDFIQFWEEIF